MASDAKRKVHSHTRQLAEQLAAEDGRTEPTREHWLRAQALTQAEYDHAAGA
jgi:hypothetical protein